MAVRALTIEGYFGSCNRPLWRICRTVLSCLGCSVGGRGSAGGVKHRYKPVGQVGKLGVRDVDEQGKDENQVNEVYPISEGRDICQSQDLGEETGKSC